ncbi:MAG TPA: AAA family ATPase [Terracidiphilus sp.]|nr:AAA family ATPase [Terracidiphilus sp.]
MSASISSNLDTNYRDSIGAEHLSIALIGPDVDRREAMAAALANCRGAEVLEFPAYPPALNDVQNLLRLVFDIIFIDVDSNPDYALELVENIYIKDSAAVMVYSAKADQEMEARCMRSGAREYLSAPFDQGNVAEALVRAAASASPKPRPVKRSGGKTLVFFGAKGGSGVTTIACNYAIALARESSQRTLLIDFGVPLGDAALNLGIAADHSTDDALQNADRLDATLLHGLVAKHDSGVFVLAAPSKVPEVPASNAAIEKLMAVAREEFDYVIVDVGSRADLMGTTLFSEATTIYMVTQAGISELRNADRLISRYFSEDSQKLEIVINRFDANSQRVTEDQITKALGTTARWRIPDDYDATRQMQSSESSLSSADSPFSRLMVEMVSSVTEQPAFQEKKKGLSLVDLGRSIAQRFTSSDKPASILSVAPSNGNNGDSAPAAPNSAQADPIMMPGNGGALPNVTWATPASIIYGTPLGAAQLNASASVQGTFAYTPSEGYVLPVGTHTLWVTFTPAGGLIVQSAVSIAVSRATPAVRWPAPDEIACGIALSDAQLKATASIPGTFVYTPAAGQVLDPGTHALSVTFTPTDDKNYTNAQASASVTVLKARPSIEWPTPNAVPSGVGLGNAQLNATASIPGTFAYSPSAGEILESGDHTLTVTFTPTDSEKYATVKATVQVTVLKAPPSITWPTPDPITYGTPLNTAQLNATASVPGTFVYNPGAGAVLAAGQHTPSVTFTPDDYEDFTPIQAAVSLTVAMAIPAIAWPTPEPIPSGTALGATELNATASVPGKFAYTPAAGKVLGIGAHKLSVTFTPTDTMNYEMAQATVSINVTELSPTEITWSVPSPISYGTALGDAQLNATASVPGTFAYSPSAGDVLPAGKHALSVIFTPADTKKYATAQATVKLKVEGMPDITSLLTATTQAPFTQAGVVQDTDHPGDVHEPVTSGSTLAEREEAPVSTPAKPEVVKPSTPKQHGPRETRTYKGAFYEKGDDGQWHLQQK